MKRIFILFFTISVFLSLVLSSCTVPNTDEDPAPQIQNESEAHFESIFNVEGDDKQETQDVQENKEEIECDNEQKIQEDQNETDEPESIESNEREYSDSGHPFNGPGTYEYKGVTFEGIYDSGIHLGGHEYHTFYIDKEFLYHGEGKVRVLYDTALDFSLAYIGADFEKMYECLSDDSPYRHIYYDPTRFNTGKENNLEYVISYKLSHSFTGVGNETIMIIFTIGIYKDGWDTGVDVCMTMLLNDEDEWRIRTFSTC